jgi:hypothetical protein
VSAAEMYERIRAACCPEHGFEADWMLDAHAKAIVLTILRLRGVV